MQNREIVNMFRQAIIADETGNSKPLEQLIESIKLGVTLACVETFESDYVELNIDNHIDTICLELRTKTVD